MNKDGEFFFFFSVLLLSNARLFHLNAVFSVIIILKTPISNYFEDNLDVSQKLILNMTQIRL